jgi:hypothetical protein
MPRKRSKTICIRLDEAEFRRFERLAETTGAQSVTALARMTIRRLITDASHSEDVSIAAHLKVVDEALHELARDVKELSYRLRENDLRRSPAARDNDLRRSSLPDRQQ